MGVIPLGTSCYACQELATTWEHAPPKGLFPRLSDMPSDYLGPDPRTNLITVPSCAVHNNSKSQSDAYASKAIATLALCLSDSLNDQLIEKFPFIRKVIETVQRGRKLRRDFIDQAQPLLTVDAVSVSVEIQTINQVVESAARAIYFHESGWAKQWPEHCLVVSPHFFHEDLRRPKNLDGIERMLDRFDSDNVKRQVNAYERGAHPSIFRYQLIEVPGGRVLVMRLVFYEIVNFLVMTGGTAQLPGNAEPTPSTFADSDPEHK